MESYFMSLMVTLISVIPPSEVVLTLVYYFGRKLFQFGPSCSNDHIRIRADVRVLPNATTKICLKTRKTILSRSKRLTEKK